jgi:serine phosphatase RsbU (regulator of sigma subunit)
MEANLPVGLLERATYAAATTHLTPGSQLTVVSDGITEAENPAGEFFGEDRLDNAALCSDINSIMSRLEDFCDGQRPADDCTVLQLRFSGLPIDEQEHSPTA